MEQDWKSKQAWKHFADTGKVGAYLLYCAIRRAAEKHE